MTPDDTARNGEKAPEISVIVCTRNPDRERLHDVMAAIEKQTMDPARYEVVVVDNGSEPALGLGDLPSGAGSYRLVREPTPGLVFARRKGIEESNGPLIVWVDDDNVLGDTYLEQAQEIAEREPTIGAFGGIAFADTAAAPKWMKPLFHGLGIRDYGPEPITSTEAKWGPWEPIGAGMVVRRPIAEDYASLVATSKEAGRLGRSPGHMGAADDTLMCRLTYRRGLSCSYQPTLWLHHLVDPSRYSLRYLGSTWEGFGRSAVTLQEVLGEDRGETGALRVWSHTARRAVTSIVLRGRAGLMEGCTEIGRAREIRRLARERS